MERPKKLDVALLVLLILVGAVRLLFLAKFHHQAYSGPSTQFEQAFVALNILRGEGVKTFAPPPAVVDAARPTILLDPEVYALAGASSIPYIKDVTGYAAFLAGLWFLAGKKLWIFAQLAQVLFDTLAALGLFVLTRKAFGRRAALATVLIFAFLVYEARAAVIAYKDVFNLYFMTLIALAAYRIWARKGNPVILFAAVSVLAGLGFYFMPNILLFPAFLALGLVVLGRFSLKRGLVCLLITAVLTGGVVLPYYSYVHAHRGDPGVPEPLFWYRLWLGAQVRVFYSTEEERLEPGLKESLQRTGLRLEEFCRREFLDLVRKNPLSYALQTLKKLTFGTFLVYANAGDATYVSSWSYFTSQNPGAGFKDYARRAPWRVLGMAAGTAAASALFPLSIIALIVLGRQRRGRLAGFFLLFPLYFILAHMFFHYEARYLLGTLPGYLPLVGFLVSALFFRSKPEAQGEI